MDKLSSHAIDKLTTSSSFSEVEDVFLPSYLNSCSVLIDYTKNIASGGQATIYNALYSTISVAVKIVDFDDYGKIKTVKENIYKEASMTMQLPQQYCVKTYGVFVDETVQPMRVGFVMKKYTTNLWKYLLDNASNLTWEHKKKLIIQCLECLQSLHSPSESFENGILHNDIKSENFLLVTDGIHVDELVVADFGFADVREYQTVCDSNNSMLGSVYDKQKGTLIYQAPETLLSEDDEVPYSKRSDLFSLGRVIGEILTCVKPFNSLKNRQRIFNACVNNDNDFTLPSDCPPLLMTVKSWCCSTDVNNRPATCELVIDFLRKCDFEQSLEEVLEEKAKICSSTERTRHRSPKTITK